MFVWCTGTRLHISFIKKLTNIHHNDKYIWYFALALHSLYFDASFAPNDGDDGHMGEDGGVGRHEGCTHMFIF
jgi:hypothetical protein